MRKTLLAAMAAAGLAAGAPPAGADDVVHLGASSPNSFAMAPLYVGIAEGIFKKHGLDADIVTFAGGARLQQGMAAGSVDFGDSGGPELAFVAKGAPEIAVADAAGPPLYLGVIVPYDSPIKTVADLKGSKIGVSSVGSLTYWLAVELARTQGWGPRGVEPVALGGDFAGRLAALRTGAVDATIEAAANGYQLEEKRAGRLLMPVSDYVKDFISVVIFASNRIVERHPEAVRRFVAAWFETVAFMRANKAETVRVARTFTGFDQAVEEREYDLTMPMWTTDGHFDPKGLATLRRSFLEMKLLDQEPEMSKLYTERFLPQR